MMLDAMSSDRHPNEQVVLSLESTDRRDFDVKKPKKTTTSNVNNGGGGGCAGGGGRRRSCRSLSNCKFTIFTDILLFIIGKFQRFRLWSLVSVVRLSSSTGSINLF